MLFGIVLDADSEYLVYFIQKTIFDSQNRAYEWNSLTVCHQFQKDWFTQQWIGIWKKLFCCFEAQHQADRVT